MKVYIFDLDDTLFPVNNINNNIGIPVLLTLKKINALHKLFSDYEIESIYSDCWRIPLDMVFIKYNLNDFYKNALIQCCDSLEVDHSLSLFSDYNLILSLKGDKYLVTTGFEKLQKSKIENLGIKNDFQQIFIDIPHINPRKNKEYYFSEIMKKYSLDSRNFIVIGDNLHSEIKSAKNLGMTTVLFDLNKEFSGLEITPDHVIHNLKEIIAI